MYLGVTSAHLIVDCLRHTRNVHQVAQARKPSGQASAYVEFPAPLMIEPGSVVNFVSKSDNPKARGNVVVLLLRQYL